MRYGKPTHPRTTYPFPGHLPVWAVYGALSSLSEHKPCLPAGGKEPFRSLDLAEEENTLWPLIHTQQASDQNGIRAPLHPGQSGKEDGHRISQALRVRWRVWFDVV